MTRTAGQMSLRYSVTPACGPYGSRLWIELGQDEWLPKDDPWLVKLCMWGGHDKRGKNYVAYEFANDSARQTAQNLLLDSGYAVTDDAGWLEER